MEEKLKKVEKEEDIFPAISELPAGELLRYHNLHSPFKEYQQARLLIGMCMDNRKHLRIPDNFAYIIRTGGGNLRYSDFKVSYAIGVGNIRHIVLIGHNHCGMVHLASKKEKFIRGLVENAGWDILRAEAHFVKYEPLFEIHDEIEFLLQETSRLRMNYPAIHVTPLFYCIEDNLLYQVYEK